MGRAGGGGGHGGGHIGGGGHFGGGHIGGHSSHGGHSSSSFGGHSSFNFGHSGVKPPHGTYSGTHYGGPRHNGTARRGSGCGGGCATSIFIIVVVIILFFSITNGICTGCISALNLFSCADSAYSYNDNYTYSSGNNVVAVEQLAVPKTKVEISNIEINGYYTDELDWIRSSYDLEKGMKEFYELTGVAPYLYITDNINGNYSPVVADYEAFCEEKYTELFDDEGHIFVVFREYNENYDTYTWCGSATSSIMDSDTIEILLDYFDAYYYNDNLTDEDYFSTVFSEAAKNIMGVEKEYAAQEKEKTEQVKSNTKKVIFIVLGVLGGIILLVGAIVAICIVCTKKMEREKEKAAETERILNTPLKDLADENAEELAKKYDKN